MNLEEDFGCGHTSSKSLSEAINLISFSDAAFIRLNDFKLLRSLSLVAGPIPGILSSREFRLFLLRFFRCLRFFVILARFGRSPGPQKIEKQI